MTEWELLSPYCITNGAYNIARTGTGEDKRYSVFDLGSADPNKAIGIFRTVEEAKKLAEALT